MRKIIGFRTLCVGLGIWVGTVVVSAQGEFKALPWSQSTAYNSYLMRDVHRQGCFREGGPQPTFSLFSASICVSCRDAGVPGGLP